LHSLFIYFLNVFYCVWVKILTPEIFSCIICLPQKLYVMDLISFLLVQAVLSGSSYIIECS
jgi:hypothetical protein